MDVPSVPFIDLMYYICWICDITKTYHTNMVKGLRHPLFYDLKYVKCPLVVFVFNFYTM